MLRHRVIPALLLDNQSLVKTTRFRDPVYIGDPLNAVRIFNEKEVDELLVIDYTATRENRGPDYELLADFATECFMPFCYGGGVRSLADADRLFHLGVEKVSLQSSCRENLSIIGDIAAKYGSQAIVASVDVKSDWAGRPRLYWSADGTTEPDWKAHLSRVIEAGAGEILLTSVDRDGTMKGPDLKLIGQAAENIKVPLVALGGVGSLDDIGAAITAGASAVAAGSYFVFHGKHKAVLITYPSQNDLQTVLGAFS